MNREKLLMFSRFQKNIILVLAGIVIGAFVIGNKYIDLNLSKLDYGILILSAFIIIWDFYEWCKVFLSKEVRK